MPLQFFEPPLDMAAEPSKSGPTNWARHLVNLWQSREDRKEKYWLCRSHGINCAHATRMRDWRLSKIERLLGIESTPT